MFRRRLLYTLSFVLVSAASASATTITFDSTVQPGSGTHSVGSSYTESGFTFASALIDAMNSGSQDYTGTGTISASDGVFTLAAADASAFDFTGITVWELNRGIHPTNVQFVGSFVGGGTISRTVSTNGTFDGDVFSFTGFTDLSSLAINGLDFTYQIDNVVVNSTAPAAVPEPASMLLLGTGLLAAAARRRLQKRR
jgi:PEP-CTERM motif